MHKKGFGVGTIKYGIIVLILLTVYLSMLPSLIHSASTSVVTLSAELSNTTNYGTTGASIGAQVDDWTGMFWVIGPLIFLIIVIMKIFRG